MQTMASTRPESARKRAAEGSSQAPGTCVEKMFSSRTPTSRQAFLAPSASASTTFGFHFVRMIPIRALLPSRPSKET